jgi:hypothetical protein
MMFTIFFPPLVHTRILSRPNPDKFTSYLVKMRFSVIISSKNTCTRYGFLLGRRMIFTLTVKRRCYQGPNIPEREISLIARKLIRKKGYYSSTQETGKKNVTSAVLLRVTAQKIKKLNRNTEQNTTVRCEPCIGSDCVTSYCLRHRMA